MIYMYKWNSIRHQRIAEEYLKHKCKSLYAFHIDKARYYADKAGWLANKK